MMILVINAGSSSLKYQLIDMKKESVLAKGLCERIGLTGNISHKTDKGVTEYETPFPTHMEAFQELVKLLTTGDLAVISSMEEISAVGHRVVQGAELYNSSVLVSDDVLSALETCSELAPLHNPANIMAIRACMEVFDPSVPQVAVFDTAFHQSIPKHAYLYSLPYELYEKYKIRRYGFHGTSHRYVSDRLAQLMDCPLSKMKVVTCHLGNGSSITAIDGGKSVDTSMGFTPLAGITMGTRCGSIDPSVVTYLMEKEGLTPKQMDDLMNKKSGYAGVSGVSSDQRDLMQAAGEGNKRAKLALDIQQYQLRKYIGSYAAAMGGLDAVVFTGGIGENSPETREAACKGLEFMGITLDRAANAACRGVEALITAPGSKVQTWVIPTNEELLIARDTKEVAGL